MNRNANEYWQETDQDELTPEELAELESLTPEELAELESSLETPEVEAVEETRKVTQDSPAKQIETSANKIATLVEEKKTIVSQPPPSSVASKCTGYDCSIEGQLCLPGTEGSSGKTWVCTNKKWVEKPIVASQPSPASVASKCTGSDCTIEGQVCLPGTEGSSGKTWTCINKKWIEKK